MKKFQKIRTVENEQVFERKLQDRGVDVVTVAPGDHLVITEKVDGANAQVTSHFGELQAFSHRLKLKEKNTLRGFYEFVMERKDEFSKLDQNLSLFGEWLVPHRIKYEDKAFRKFYLFDIFDFNTKEYLGYDKLAEYYNELFVADKDIELVPLLYRGAWQGTYSELIEFQKENEKNSNLIDGPMEGIVVSDLSKIVPIDEENSGPLRIKLVNEKFKETRKTKKVLTNDESELEQWLQNNITDQRISKQLFALQEDGYLDGDPTFSWLQNGNSARIAMETVNDAIKESEELPKLLTSEEYFSEKIRKQSHRYAMKRTNRFLALTIKGLI